jgi:hypothetical protein
LQKSDLMTHAPLPPLSFRRTSERRILYIYVYVLLLENGFVHKWSYFRKLWPSLVPTLRGQERIVPTAKVHLQSILVTKVEASTDISVLNFV